MQPSGPAAALGPAAPSAKAVAKQQQMQVERLFELVKMICDWVDRSFAPQQEERMKEKGRLYARFKVDLGKDMLAQLQAYVGASFKLKLLKFRAVQREVPGRPPQECVEVILSPEARDLYAEKCPDAAARYRMQVDTCPAGAEGDLEDANGEEGGRTPLAIEAAADGVSATPSAGSKRALGADTPEGAAAKAQRRARGAGSEVAVRAADEAKPPAPEQAGPPVAGAGSAWEKVSPLPVAPGAAGLLEARDALEKALAQVSGGGMAAIRAEKDLAAWLKGLQGRAVGGSELKETRIGLVVNECRKHAEPYIAGLAAALLGAWKKAWREGERGVRQRPEADRG